MEGTVEIGEATETYGDTYVYTSKRIVGDSRKLEETAETGKAE